VDNIATDFQHTQRPQFLLGEHLDNIFSSMLPLGFYTLGFVEFDDVRVESIYLTSPGGISSLESFTISEKNEVLLKVLLKGDGENHDYDELGTFFVPGPISSPTSEPSSAPSG
jgi:hypothetical protein